jgi:hypothetical protein
MIGELRAMRRDRRDEELITLVVGVAGALWRWRLELGLVAALVGAQVALSQLVGAVLAGMAVSVLVAAVLAVPGTWRWLRRALWAARIRRAWWRAWTDCELARVRAGRVTSIPAGELVQVRASRGSSLEFVEARAEELAVCLQAREVRVARDPDNAATGTVKRLPERNGVLFPSKAGGRIDINNWRSREWAPALKAAGIEHRRIYDMRHTFATWSLAAGMSVFTLSRRMGTSVQMIDETYGHLARDEDEYDRGLLDAYDEAEASIGHVAGTIAPAEEPGR